MLGALQPLRVPELVVRPPEDRRDPAVRDRDVRRRWVWMGLARLARRRRPLVVAVEDRGAVGQIGLLDGLRDPRQVARGVVGEHHDRIPDGWVGARRRADERRHGKREARERGNGQTTDARHAAHL